MFLRSEAEMEKKYDEIQSYIVKVRRDLHQIPEFGKNLPKTTEYITKELDKMGIKYKVNTLDTGIVAVIEGKNTDKCVALRADIDALEQTEETDLPFKSTNGCMHGCGHDAHGAMLLGAAKILSKEKESLNGSVKLIFQTAEEISRGAEIMVAEGALENPKVDALFAMHIGTVRREIPLGNMGIVKGKLFGSFDKFTIKVIGKDAHGCTPERGVDPITTSALIVSALQNIVSREIITTEPHIISLGKIHGGTAYNTIPETVEIEGTIRATTQEVRMFLAKRIEEVAKGIAESMRAKVDFEIIWGAPPVINDDAMAELAQKAAAKVIGEDAVVKDLGHPSMGGEDISYYFEKVKGCYMLLSSLNADKKADFPQHSTHFDIDEDVMWRGSAVFAQIARDFLNEK